MKKKTSMMTTCMIIGFSLFTFGTLGQLLVAMLLPYFPMFKYTIVSFSVAFIATFPMDAIAWAYRDDIAKKAYALVARYNRWFDRVDARGPSRRDWLAFLLFYSGVVSALFILAAIVGRLDMILLFFISMSGVIGIILMIEKRRSKSSAAPAERVVECTHYKKREPPAPIGPDARAIAHDGTANQAATLPGPGNAGVLGWLGDKVRQHEQDCPGDTIGPVQPREHRENDSETRGAASARRRRRERRRT